MKKFYILMCCSLFIVSCSGDDDSTNGANNSPEESTTDYLPLTNGNYWVYNTQSSMQTGHDSLYIEGDMTIAGNSYKKFTTFHLPFGFYSTSLYNNGMRKSGDKLMVSGVADLSFSPEFPLTVPVTDLVIFKEHTSANQPLGSASGSIVQPYDGYDVKFDYVLSTKAVQDLSAYTVGQDTYTGVKQVQTVINLKVSLLVPEFAGIPVVILDSQNVMVSNQYYAEHIGVVHVVTDINYTLQDLMIPGLQLPIPQQGSEHQEEVLDHYSID